MSGSSRDRPSGVARENSVFRGDPDSRDLGVVRDVVCCVRVAADLDIIVVAREKPSGVKYSVCSVQ